MLGFKGLNHSINQAHPYRSILAKNADCSLLHFQLVSVFLNLGLKLVNVHSARLSVLSLLVQRKTVELDQRLVRQNRRRRLPCDLPRAGTALAALGSMTAELEVEQDQDGGWVARIPAGQDPETF